MATLQSHRLPYKSVLKILLTEVYAAEYPHVEPLSTQFKRAIYNDQLDIDELDPYVVVYRKLEQYLLNRNELKRLELVRRCFYFKIGKALSRPSRDPRKSWQRQLMEKLVQQWQWPREQIYNLDARKQWKVSRVIEEQKQLVRELTNSYRFVLELARRTRSSAMINSQEMTVLGRKLYAAFERKAGKIEWVNPGIANNLIEEQLTFYQTQTSHDSAISWAVSAEPLAQRDISRDQPIKRADEIITLMAWCHFNKLLDHTTQLNIVEGDHGISEYELHSMFRSLRQHLSVAKSQNDTDDEKHDRFSQAMRPLQIQLFINVGVDPLAQMRTQGMERLSAHTDSLGYSGLKENLVLNLEQVMVNSWGELSSRRYDGDFALIRCINDYLQLLPPGSRHGLPKLDVQCFCPTRASAIKLRVEELFRDIAACYYSGTRPANTRYVLEIQREYYVLQFTGKTPRFERAGNYSALLTYLGQSQQEFSPIVLDRYCLKHSALSAIVQQSLANQIQVYYQPQEDSADVYVLDEKGSLFYFNTPFRDEYTLLSPLDQFIQSTLFRRSSEHSHFLANHNSFELDNFDLSHYEIEFYQINQSINNVQLSRRNVLNHIEGTNFFNVQAIADQDLNGRILFNIYCDQQEFTELEFGKALYNTAAKFILSRRNSQERYPCYITDLDLSRYRGENNTPSQTIDYLKHKQKLEQALNHALQAL